MFIAEQFIATTLALKAKKKSWEADIYRWPQNS